MFYFHIPILVSFFLGYSITQKLRKDKSVCLKMDEVSTNYGSFDEDSLIMCQGNSALNDGEIDALEAKIAIRTKDKE